MEKLDRTDRDTKSPIGRIASILPTKFKFLKIYQHPWDYRYRWINPDSDTADYILSYNITGYDGIDRTHWWIYHTHDRVVKEQEYDDDYQKENIMTFEEFHDLRDREGWEKIAEEIVVAR